MTRRHRRRLGTIALPMTAVLVLGLVASSCATIVPGTACGATPTDSVWRADVSGLPVAANSNTWITNSGQNPTGGSPGTTARLKADFGAGLWEGTKIGIPFNVVDSTTPRYNVTFDIDDESDNVPYPIPNNPNIEGGGDRHIISVDKDTCRLYELWASRKVGARWEAGSGATWDMTSNAMRQNTWTSGDAAGLQILPGLVRYDEVVTDKVINHAIRITIPHTQKAFQWPASHQAGDTTSASYPKMGAWMRLKASVNPDSYDEYLRPIIVALKKYGAIVADNGSPFYMSGVPDDRWNNDKLALLNGSGPNGLKGSNFEYVDTTSLKVANNSYQASTAT